MSFDPASVLLGLVLGVAGGTAVIGFIRGWRLGREETLLAEEYERDREAGQ